MRFDSVAILTKKTVKKKKKKSLATKQNQTCFFFFLHQTKSFQPGSDSGIGDFRNPDSFGFIFTTDAGAVGLKLALTSSSNECPQVSSSRSCRSRRQVGVIPAPLRPPWLSLPSSQQTIRATPARLRRASPGATCLLVNVSCVLPWLITNSRRRAFHWSAGTVCQESQRPAASRIRRSPAGFSPEKNSSGASVQAVKWKK